MKKNELRLITVSVASAALFALSQSTVLGQAVTVYDNSTAANYQGSGVSRTVEFGDDITLAGSARVLDTFKFEYYASGLGGGEVGTLRLYQVNGAVNTQGQATPGTLITSGTFNLANGFNTVTLSAEPATLPDRLAWTVEFGGIGAGETAQLPIYNPPTVGSSFDDFWVREAGGWSLFRFPGGSPAGNFAAQVTAVPEATTIAYGVAGALALFGFLRSRRNK